MFFYNISQFGTWSGRSEQASSPCHSCPNTWPFIHSLTWEAHYMTNQPHCLVLQLHAWLGNLASSSNRHLCFKSFSEGSKSNKNGGKAWIQSSKSKANDSRHRSLTLPRHQGFSQKAPSWSINVHPSGFWNLELCLTRKSNFLLFLQSHRLFFFKSQISRNANHVI